MSKIVDGRIVLNPIEQARYDLHRALQEGHPRLEGESFLDWEIRLIGIRNKRLNEMREEQKNGPQEIPPDRQTP